MITTLALVLAATGASSLPVAAQEGLARNGFTVFEGQEKHFFSLYDRNAYQKIPSFISVDVVLHVFHVRLDEDLASAERRRLLPALETFASSQLSTALALWPKQGPVDPALEALTLYHAIAVTLLDAGTTPLDPRIAAAATAEATKLRAASGTVQSKACGASLDASLFLPRGHYAGTDLRGFFQASTWYSQCVFPLDAKGLPRALDVVRLIDPRAATALREVEAARALVAGPADDPGARELQQLLAEPLPALPQPVPPKVLDGVLTQVRTLPAARVASLHGPVFALLGGARTFDGEILGAVGAKRMPSALDVLAALGSVGALRLLGRPPPDAGSPPSMSRGGGLSQQWLDTLAVLLGPAPAGQPPYARTSAWEGRVMTSAAGSWAELKHDTLLVVKQPVVMREGGHEAELPASQVGGFVDPRPDVYRALLALNEAARPLRDGEDALGEFLHFAIEVSELELAGKPFPKAMDARLRTVGSELEQLVRTHGDRTPLQALIADVLTVEFPDQPRQVLHVGVGDVDELWIKVPRAGQQVLMRGGVFSYYEFARETRLTDEGFMGELYFGTPPPRPFWAKPVPRPARKKTKD